MKVIGRLALAAALLVPVGIATANTAGASSGTVTCTSTTAKIATTPGLLLSSAASQTLAVTSAAPGTVSNCTGFGIATGHPTTGSLTLSVQTPTHVTCQSIVGKQDNGNGKIVWATASHNGSSTFKAGIKITGPTTALLTGTVTTSSGNYLKGEHITASLTFSPNIAPQGVGAGTCSNVHKIKSLSATAANFKIS